LCLLVQQVVEQDQHPSVMEINAIDLAEHQAFLQSCAALIRLPLSMRRALHPPYLASRSLDPIRGDGQQSGQREASVQSSADEVEQYRKSVYPRRARISRYSWGSAGHDKGFSDIGRTSPEKEERSYHPFQ
jgi:hypothetical protein